MKREDMLTGLVAQAVQEGGALPTLRALVEEAGELGAERVLARLGLADTTAGRDIDELRVLLQAWRAAKASAWKAAVGWVMHGLLALLLIGFAWRFGVAELLK